jgi:hypothetical protein
MAEHFSEDGISFRYPENWRLEREEGEDGWTVSVYSPSGTAFALFSLDRRTPLAEDMAETTLEALRDDYPELEAEPCIDSLAGQMAVGHDISFFSFDLTNTCWTRSIYGEAGTLLVLCQTSDLEEKTATQVLRAICASLEVETE